jgi:pilus assembly protein CpaB
MSIGANYPGTETVLAPAGSGAGIAALIPPGMRLVPVDVSDQSGVAALITPGSKVDVMVTLHDGEQPVAKTVVQNVKVQLVQRQSMRSSSGRVNAGNQELGPVKSASLLVTPEQALKIELANSEGKTRLLLRGGSDMADSDASINRNGLLGKADEVKPEPVKAIVPEPPKKGWEIQVIKGGTETKTTFDENGKAEESSGAAPAAAGKTPKKPAGEQRNDSGTVPDEAPRTDAGRGNLP